MKKFTVQTYFLVRTFIFFHSTSSAPFFINLSYYENTNDHYHPCVLLVLEGDLVRKPTAYIYWSSSGLDFTEDAKNGTKIFGYADHIHKYR